MSEGWGIIYYFSGLLSQTSHTQVEWILWKNKITICHFSTFLPFSGCSILNINWLINLIIHFPWKQGLNCKTGQLFLHWFYFLSLKLWNEFSYNILVINITLEKLEKSLKYLSPQIISSYNFESSMKRNVLVNTVYGHHLHFDTCIAWSIDAFGDLKKSFDISILLQRYIYIFRLVQLLVYHIHLIYIIFDYLKPHSKVFIFGYLFSVLSIQCK